MSTQDVIFEKLKTAMSDYDAEETAEWAQEAIEAGIDPADALDVLTSAIREIGDGFGRGELFLPDLVLAGEAMKTGAAVLEGEIRKRGGARKSKRLVIGTAKGDIHDIGKSLVATMFIAAGFNVVDLGIDVPKEAFVEAVKEYEPDILGLSALLSSTALEQGKVIDALSEAGLRDKVIVMVGGGAVTEDFAQKVGADGYGENAAEAVLVANRLVEG
jgi:corrinoid protein of di/trimethylamine methyltransferase